MNYGNENNYNYGEENIRKKSPLFKVMRWTVYSLCILIMIVVAYRLISTGTPKELKNYIAKSPEITEKYKSLKDDFKIYKIDVRTPFALGDALYIVSAYYLESSENLQVILRCKNEKFAQLILSSLGVAGNIDENHDNPTAPFKTWLKVSANVNINSDENETKEENKEPAPDYVIIEPLKLKENTFGKTGERYKYFIYSFGGVQIDYANSKVELYVFYDNHNQSEVIFDENEALTRFTVFDVNMPKTRIPAKDFKLD